MHPLEGMDNVPQKKWYETVLLDIQKSFLLSDHSIDEFNKYADKMAFVFDNLVEIKEVIEANLKMTGALKSEISGNG